MLESISLDRNLDIPNADTRDSLKRVLKRKHRVSTGIASNLWISNTVRSELLMCIRPIVDRQEMVLDIWAWDTQSYM